VLRILAWSLKIQTLLIWYTDVLVIATIAGFGRFMTVFFIASNKIGPMVFVILRLFKDVVRWFFIFLLFVVSFQAGIFAFTRQAGQSGWHLFPNGSMGAGLTAIIGDLGSNTMDWMVETRVGVILVIVYSFVTQVLLVALLIAMMGNSYNNVKKNSDQEWKFHRYSMIKAYKSTSEVPPPLNIIQLIFKLRCRSDDSDDTELDILVDLTRTEKFLRQATQRVIAFEEEKAKTSSDSIHEKFQKMDAKFEEQKKLLQAILESQKS